MKRDNLTRFREASRCAEELITELGIESLPIDPFEIAKSRGITIEAKQTQDGGVSGFLIRVGDEFCIGYATHIDNEGFRRFTVAHELGHYFLPNHPEQLFPNGDGIHSSYGGFCSSDMLELEADHFAANLLMPATLFKKVLSESRKQGFAAVEFMADKCQTSITSTAIRFATHSDDPVAVIVSSGDRIDYCFMSDALKEGQNFTWLKKGDYLPSNSLTSSFNKTASNVLGGQRKEGYLSLTEWFDGAPDVEFKEDVVGLGSYGKSLTVLFTDQALPDEDEDFDE